MSEMSQKLKKMVTERLTAAAEEIFVLVEKTITEYEEELCRSREENQRRQQLLDELLNKIDATVPHVKQEQSDNPQIHEAPRVEVKEENPEQLPITQPHHTGVATETHCQSSAIATESHWEDTGLAKETNWEGMGVSTETNWEGMGVSTETHWEDTGMASETHWELDIEEDMNTYEPLTDTNNVEEEKEDVQNWTVPLNEDMAYDEVEPETQTQDRDTEQGPSAAGDVSIFPKNKRLVCSFCEKKFARLCQLKSHMVIHGCSFCQKVCPNEESLKLHIMRHTGEVTYESEEEVDTQTQDRNMNKDQSEVSELRIFPKKPKTISCSLCKKTFASYYYLTKHKKTHEIEYLTCSFCQKICANERKLRMHVMLHTGERPFQCHLCDKSSRTKGELNAHLATHSKVRPFRCLVCSAAFKARPHLEKHMYQHTGIRAFKCTFCVESFKRKWELEWHMYKHTGIQPGLKIKKKKYKWP